MNPSKSLVATGIAVILAGTAPAVFAQHHGGGGGHSSGGAASRGSSRAASPRSAAGSPQTATPRGPSSVRGGGFVPGGAIPRYSIVAPVQFYRPYYSFRPRLSLGFGLWAGYPFAYWYGFYDPFYYPYGYGPMATSVRTPTDHTATTPRTVAIARPTGIRRTVIPGPLLRIRRHRITHPRRTRAVETDRRRRSVSSLVRRTQVG